MTTISTSTPLGVTLTPASYTNPVVVAAGVSISNDTGDGISGAGEYFSVQNNGTIAGNDGGVALYDGGGVTNLPGGDIVATSAIHSAVYIGGGAGTVVNAGAITGDGASGVDLKDGGGITNQSGGTIGSGGTHTAVYGTAAAVAMVNAGVIYGINLLAGGTVVNQAGGTIERAGLGVYLAGGVGTVINAGTIDGTGSGSTNAVLLPAGYANRVVVDPGASFNGVVSGGNAPGNSIVSTLELAAAASVGTLAGLGGQFVNFDIIAFDAGSQWSIAGNTAGLAATITGFAAGDTIEVAGVTATGSIYLGKVLTLEENRGSATLTLPGSFTRASFDVTSNSNGAEVTIAPCFAAGTRLLGIAGEVAVEALTPGALLVTRCGRLRMVRWIGRRHVALSQHPQPRDGRPVRVGAHALAPGVPHRDLVLSPDHAVFAGGALIPVRHLLNGASIAEIAGGEITYFHVELAEHAVLLADGLPAESYLDTGNRAGFESSSGAQCGQFVSLACLLLAQPRRLDRDDGTVAFHRLC